MTTVELNSVLTKCLSQNCHDGQECVVLGLGSNMHYAQMTQVELMALGGAFIKDTLQNVIFSSLYRTSPLYYTEQQSFYNMVAVGYIDGGSGLLHKSTPYRLLQNIHIAESVLGRNRSAEIRNGPRPIDIDIEFFGARKVNSADLTIPHQKVMERAFVLTPLCEILERLNTGGVRYLKEHIKSLPNQTVEKCGGTVQYDFMKLMLGISTYRHCNLLTVGAV